MMDSRSSTLQIEDTSYKGILLHGGCSMLKTKTTSWEWTNFNVLPENMQKYVVFCTNLHIEINICNYDE